jgi:hypothetical protein
VSCWCRVLRFRLPQWMRSKEAARQRSGSCDGNLERVGTFFLSLVFHAESNKTPCWNRRCCVQKTWCAAPPSRFGHYGLASCKRTAGQKWEGN